MSGKSQAIYEFNLLTSTLTSDLINAANIPLINFRGDMEKATFIGGANSIEYTLPGIGQTQVNNKAGYDFASGLRSILRQDPDIVMVGEIRDIETAKIAIQASLTGHLVLSTIHTNSAIGAIARLRDMGIESYLLASSLRVVIAQRLVRRLCEDCKSPVKPSATIQKEFQLDKNENIYQAVGCANCNHTGFKGRIALAECINISDELKALIHDEASD